MKVDVPDLLREASVPQPAGHRPAASSALAYVLVVIPTLNEARTIARVLEELHADLPAHANVRFVVCDGGSTDGTPALVEQLGSNYPAVSLLHNPKRLQSAAVNLAAQHHGIGAEILVRCDAHAHYPAGFIRRLLVSLEAHEADAVVVPMDSTGGSCLQSAVAWVSDSLVGSGGSAHRGGRRSGLVDHGHHAAFRMASFLRAGGYDETFSHNEDAELDCRQRRLGSRIYLDADIRVSYLPRSTWPGLWRQYFQYGRGRSRTMRRHPGSARLRQWAVPLHVLASMAAVAALPLTAWGLLWPAAYLTVLTLTSLLMALRHRSLCGLMCGPAAGVMHLAWACGLASGLLTLREHRWEPSDAKPLTLHAPRSPGAGTRR